MVIKNKKPQLYLIFAICSFTHLKKKFLPYEAKPKYSIFEKSDLFIDGEVDESQN